MDDIMEGKLVFNRMRQWNGKRDVFLSNIAFDGKSPAMLAKAMGMTLEQLGMVLNDDGTQVFQMASGTDEDDEDSKKKDKDAAARAQGEVIELGPEFSPRHVEESVEVKMARDKEAAFSKKATPKLAGDAESHNATAETADPSEVTAPLAPSPNASNASSATVKPVPKLEAVFDPFDEGTSTERPLFSTSSSSSSSSSPPLSVCLPRLTQ